MMPAAAQAPAPKDVQATSLEAHDQVAPTVARRERAVLVGLSRCYAMTQQWPTAYELFAFMADRKIGGVRDLNSVRPRLTSLKQQGKVSHPDEKRRCQITGKRALLWQLPERRLF